MESNQSNSTVDPASRRPVLKDSASFSADGASSPCTRAYVHYNPSGWSLSVHADCLPFACIVEQHRGYLPVLQYVGRARQVVALVSLILMYYGLTVLVRSY